MKKNVCAVVAVVALALPGVSQAQLGGLLGGSKSSSNSGADLAAQQDSLVRGYVAAGKDVLTANSHMADALGNKAEAANALATANSLSEKNIGDGDKAISASAAAVAEGQKSGATLKDAESKAKYAKGLVVLVSGVKKYIDLRKDAQGFTSGLSGVSPLQLVKLQSGAYIVKSLPGSVSSLTTTLKNAVDFAKSNGVEVPKDATSLL